MKQKIIGDGGEIEELCRHGVGHGKGVHTCDGYCKNGKIIEHKRN